ncbi:sugar ABC transporter ATP-binding protein [Halobacteriales archaeon QH_6_64_20]|nr:MAG: sugar ABC transporter ATP-binding protein [Halobacteriales archaeon QH_6_64_20]
MGALEIDGLTKTFGDGETENVAVDDLSLTIEDGEFLTLVGPSGCGKSTTLRCVAGLETPTSGEIRLDGETVTGRKPKNRGMAMVFQSYALYPHKTAFDNMAFGLRMTTDLSKGEIDEKVRDAARVMEIEDLLDNRPSTLSGGQQQRVALGRAIVREPEVFLLDEPLSNLDAKLRSGMRTELQDLQQRLDVTTLYVTHDQTEAMTMGDRIAVLDGGHLQQVGTPLECYHEPRNRFVAGFIGSPSMNFLDCTLRDGVIHHDAFEYRLSTPTEASSAGSRDVTLGIRPEDLDIVDSATGGLNDESDASGASGVEGAGGADGTMDATVTVVEPTGNVTVFSIDIGSQVLTASTADSLDVDRGARITVGMAEENVHLFDRETGAALSPSAATQAEEAPARGSSSS